MRGRGVGGGSGGVPTDLLVCFPPRPHLPLMPKPICSPSRHPDCGKRRPTRPATRGRARSLFKTEAEHMSWAEVDEPTSPKVTCAGQIKVMPKPRPRPRSHGGSGDGDRSWLEALGLKKDIMHFLGALRGLRFGIGCFGSFHGAVDCTSDEEDGVEDVEDGEREEENDGPATVFSNWDNVGIGNEVEEEAAEEEEEDEDECRNDNEFSNEASSSAPPPNALLLMRCRSSPSTSWSQRGGRGGGGGEGDEMMSKMMEEEEEIRERERERLILMSYAPDLDLFKMSSEIAKETWVVGGRLDPLARSRSWKR